MSINKNQITQGLAVIFLVCVCAGIGFYFGSKITGNKINELKKQHTTELAKVQEETDKKTTENIVVKEVTGVQWIRPNQEPICDKDHPIKGVSKSGPDTYYTKTYKTYEKIKPEICFATEEIARDTAGFIKKF